MTIRFSKHACLRIQERFQNQAADLYLKLESTLLKASLVERDHRRSVIDSYRGRPFKVVFVETSGLSFQIITVILLDR